MKNRVLALLLIVVLCVGMFAGCNKPQDPSDPNQPSASDKPSASKKEEAQNQNSFLGKYAYKPTWLQLVFDDELKPEYISNFDIIGDKMYFYAECMGEAQPMIDPVTGEVVIDESTGEPYMESKFRSVIFSADLKTGETTALDAYEPYEIPEGHEGSAYISSIQKNPDGTMWLAERVNTWYYDLPEDFNSETDDPYAYYTQGLNMLIMHQITTEGEKLNSVEINVPQDVYLNNVYALGSGEFAASDWQSIHIFDQNGQPAGTVESQDNINNLFMLPDGSLAVWIWRSSGDYGNDYLAKLDIQAKTLVNEIKLGTNAYSLYFGLQEFDYIYNYNGTFFGHKEGVEEDEKVLSWIDWDVDSNTLNGETVFGDNGYVYSLESVWDEQKERNSYSVVIMEPIDPSEVTVKQELALACFNLPWDMRSDIVAFNKSSEDVRIVIKEYSQYATEEDPYAGLQKLNTEIMSGVIPDLFLLNNTMPIDRYTAQGIFMDLWPLIDSDAEIEREDLMTHFFDALSVDGKLYQITDTFTISTLVGKESVVGSGDTWTMSDLIATLDAQEEGTTIFGVYDTKETILNDFITRNAENFIDWETLQCSFNSQEFIDYLKFANRFPAEINYDEIYEDEFISLPEAARLRSGSQLLYRMNLYNFEAVQWGNAVFDEKANYIGYPTESNNGSCFEVYETLAISAACDNVEAAWKFVRKYLTEEHQTQEYMYEFPTNKHSFDAMVEMSKEIDYYEDYETGEQLPAPHTTIWYGDEDMKELYAMTDEDLAVFMDVYNSCNNFYKYNRDIAELVQQEADAFFNGQKTAEEAARLIQDRVSLYVMENG